MEGILRQELLRHAPVDPGLFIIGQPPQLRPVVGADACEREDVVLIEEADMVFRIGSRRLVVCLPFIDELARTPGSKGG